CDGLAKATQFYNEMRETVESLQKNVDTFVNNRRNEGAQLLSQIEAGKGTEAEREQKRMKELMEKLSMGPPSGASRKQSQPPRPLNMNQPPTKPSPPVPNQPVSASAHHTS